MSRAQAPASGASTAVRIQSLLQPLLPEQIEVRDQSAAHAGHPGAAGGGGHFRVRIVSDRFAGLSPLQRQRWIHELLAPLFGREIHALSMQLLTPEEITSQSHGN